MAIPRRDATAYNLVPNAAGNSGVTNTIIATLIRDGADSEDSDDKALSDLTRSVLPNPHLSISDLTPASIFTSASTREPSESQPSKPTTRKRGTSKKQPQSNRGKRPKVIDAVSALEDSIIARRNNISE